ncbi:MAG: hypothetical protein HY966_02765 [Ignavibacteriales bacterium]|nr:hypothetical protein [Ignavibacteriales bacterium]
MGNSKIILLAGFILSFGFLVAMVKEADQRIVVFGEQNYYKYGSELVSAAATNLAVYYLSTPSWSDGMRMKDYPVFGGTLTYTVDYAGLPSNQARVTIRSKYQGTTIDRIAILEKIDPTVSKGRRTWSQWQIKQTITFPSTSTTSVW